MKRDTPKIILIGILLYLIPSLSIKLARYWFSQDHIFENFDKNGYALFKSFWLNFILCTVLFFGTALYFKCWTGLTQDLSIRILASVLLVATSFSGNKWETQSWSRDVFLNERIYNGLDKLSKIASAMLLIYIFSAKGV
jgi:hypothetical protein